MNNLDTELIDLMELIEFTMSIDFLNKWKMKYGERLIRLFQIKILDSLKKQKPLKISSLCKFLIIDSGFNNELIMNFLKDIDSDIYSPILLGKLDSIDLKEYVK
jgi:hypothetical protein